MLCKAESFTPKKTSFGADLVEDMKLVLAHHRGEVGLEQVWPRPINLKAIDPAADQ